MKIERDLELDLPSDLTAALERSMQHRPQRRDSSKAQTFSQEESLSGEKIGEKAREAFSFGLGRRLGDEARKHLQYDTTADSHASGAAFDDPSLSPSYQNAAVGAYSNIDADDHTVMHRTTASMDSGMTASDTSLDAEWVGDLPREELEKLLFESRQIIKERDRDLSIAAMIGKALLDKNISLRNRHEGIVSRFSSMNSMERMIAEQGEDVNTPLPRYSPPHTDADTTLMAGDSTAEQCTPRPVGLANSGSGYFQGLQASPSAVRLARLNATSTIDALHILESPSDATHHWSPSMDHYVPSIPSSPSAQASRAPSNLPMSETHRRLEMIVEQNDTLLEQISQLQNESEAAKKEGGRRQKKLIREIDGLRADLEAAEARTMELERKAEVQKQATTDKGSGQQDRKRWRRRGTLPWKASGTPDPQSPIETPLSLEGSGTTSSLPGSLPQMEDGGESAETDARSESSASVRSRTQPQTESERAIVAQLMTKVRELEEINSALIRDAHERDGRIGRFLEDSERLRDLYDAVENEAVSTLSATPSMQDLTVITHTSTPVSSAAASPASRRRRAPGNRYLIEGRRTMRAAMRSDIDVAQLSSDELTYSNTSNSTQASPTQARRVRRMHRPRILITPSCEDLHAHAEADKVAGWQDIDLTPIEKPVRRRLQSSSSDISIGEHFMNEHATPVGGSSLGSGSIALRYRASEGDFSSVQSLTSFAGQCSLGSELDRMVSDDDVSGQQDLPQQDGDSRPCHPPSNRVVRRTVSEVSLRAMSEAESDIADLRWSNSISKTRTENNLPEIKMSSPEPPKQLALTASHRALATVCEQDDGDWFSTVAQDVIPTGSLRNDVETSHENYVVLEKLTANVPVHWADDEDFGKPITERDARKLGLMEGPPSHAKVTRGLLSWMTPRKVAFNGTEGKGKKRDVSNRRQLEDANDVARREALERLLRAKRIASLHDRVVNGQMSAEEARQKGAFDDPYESDHSGLAQFSFENEVTQRAFAYRSVRRRQSLNAAEQAPSSPPKMLRSSPRRKFDRDGEAEMQKHFQESQRLALADKAALDGKEDKFELVDLEPSKRRPGRRGTDYYPITLRERYRPDMVKQRVHQFSNETITWAMAWASFSVVMVFAFVAAFARGPKRVLHGQHSRQG